MTEIYAKQNGEIFLTNEITYYPDGKTKSNMRYIYDENGKRIGWKLTEFDKKGKATYSQGEYDH